MCGTDFFFHNIVDVWKITSESSDSVFSQQNVTPGQYRWGTHSSWSVGNDVVIVEEVLVLSVLWIATTGYSGGRVVFRGLPEYDVFIGRVLLRCVVVNGCLGGWEVSGGLVVLRVVFVVLLVAMVGVGGCFGGPLDVWVVGGWVVVPCHVING